MQIRIILKSKSNKDLGLATAKLVDISKSTNCVIAGPVSFKNKKLIDFLNANNRTVDFLMKVKLPKSITVEVKA